MLRELRAHFEKWRILGYFLAKFPLEKPKITILTYNCAHLKSTKESLTVEGGTGWYRVGLGQYGAFLVDI